MFESNAGRARIKARDDAREILKYATETRKFEIERFWQRSLFFWGFIASAFVAYAAVINKDLDDDTALLISCFGLVCSVAWTLQNRGGKYWQEAWEQKVAAIEVKALGISLYNSEEPVFGEDFWGASRYSVSRLTIALSDFTVVVWIVLGVKAFPWACGGPGVNPSPYILGTFTVVYVGCLFVGGHSSSKSWRLQS